MPKSKKQSHSQTSSLEQNGDWTKKILEKFAPKKPPATIPLSLILPVFNCSERIGETLESIKRQNYSSLEVIVVDAGSTDHTLEIVNSYYPLISRIYTVADYHPVEMLNRGIVFATGQYIAVLFPGSFYLSNNAFQTMANAVLENHFPELVFSGSIQREGGRTPRLLYAPLDIDFLEKGKQPTALPACWFRSDLFETMGKLNPSYPIRAGFDFFCRLALEPHYRSILLERVYIDYDFGLSSYPKYIKFATETCRILYSHFGFWKAFIWFLGLKHLSILRLWLKNMKQKI